MILLDLLLSCALGMFIGAIWNHSFNRRELKRTKLTLEYYRCLARDNAEGWRDAKFKLLAEQNADKLRILTAGPSKKAAKPKPRKRKPK